MDAVTPPTYPFHIARAYGIATPARPAPVAAPTPGVIVRASGDSVEISGVRRSPALSASLERIAAAKVDKAPEFAAAALPAGSGLPMYRHPADRNLAATGVQVGRVVDLQG